MYKASICEDDFPVITMHVSEINKIILMEATEDDIKSSLEPLWTVASQSPTHYLSLQMM